MDKYLADNGYDGLGIDVEHPNASTSIAANFKVYCAGRAEFKSITGKDMCLAAGPQITGMVLVSEQAEVKVLMFDS